MPIGVSLNGAGGRTEMGGVPWASHAVSPPVGGSRLAASADSLSSQVSTGRPYTGWQEDTRVPVGGKWTPDAPSGNRQTRSLLNSPIASQLWIPFTPVGADYVRDGCVCLRWSASSLRQAGPGPVTCDGCGAGLVAARGGLAVVDGGAGAPVCPAGRAAGGRMVGARRVGGWGVRSVRPLGRGRRGVLVLGVGYSGPPTWRSPASVGRIRSQP